MTIQDKFILFHNQLVVKYNTMEYNSILEKEPFDELEGLESSVIHDLIEEGYLNLISLDISKMDLFKYTINLSDKALVQIKESQLEFSAN